MTIKEAILRSLEDIKGLTNYIKICEHIIKNKYYDFGDAQTPPATVSAQLGDFIRTGDARVKRIKKERGKYVYYLTKNEQTINVDEIIASSPSKTETSKESNKVKSFKERDLHKLLSSFLKNSNIFSKTIFHEQSKFGSDNNQKWAHPDMVGINFLKLQTSESQNFLKTINRNDTFNLSSYEIKKEINSDYELKKAFFQAVSNSSWANYSYLVAFDFGDSLFEEMERLNQSFGVGIIKLKANPFQSKILFQPKYREFQIKTIDKLCKINSEFKKFIEHVEKLMSAEEKYYEVTEKEFFSFCDICLINDTDIEIYCKERNIPIDV